MYAVISPSENTAPVSGVVPLRRWADGAAEVSFVQTDGETRLRHLYQSDPCRVLFPRQAGGAPKEAVIVTTSGGVVGGDRLRVAIGARDEAFTYGFLHDDWRVFMDGNLVWADALHLSGDIGAAIDNVHAFDGAAAVATAIYCAPDAAAYLEAARDMVGNGGASCIDGILVVRMVDRDAAALRAGFAQFWKTFRHETAGLPAALPRVWEV